MNQNKFLKFFAIIAFLVLMSISCWAAVESVHLLLPSWPVFILWAMIVFFFLLASIGTKLIVDSFNQRIMIEHRGWRLIGGIILLIIFWILPIFATNAHTFFYLSTIRGELNSELVNVEQHLNVLLNDGQAKIFISKEKDDFSKKINDIFVNLENEIKDKNNEGYGPRAKQLLSDLKTVLGNDAIIQEPHWSNTAQGRLNTIESLRSQKDALLNARLNNYDSRLANINQGINKNNIKNNITKMKDMQNYLLQNGKINDKFLADAKSVLRNSITLINNYFDNLKTNWGYDSKSPYHNNEPEIEKNEKIDKVWSNFFQGKLAGSGFIFWILIAALIDIAGFIFFDIAFKRDE